MGFAADTGMMECFVAGRAWDSVRFVWLDVEIGPRLPCAECKKRRPDAGVLEMRIRGGGGVSGGTWRIGAGLRVMWRMKRAVVYCGGWCMRAMDVGFMDEASSSCV